MIASLVAVALAVLPASGEVTWLDLEAAAQLDLRTLKSSIPPRDPPTGLWRGGSGMFGITVYGRRVVDDDAAPPLQPFLQRAARFHLEAGGGAADIEYPAYILSAVEPSGHLVLYRTSDRSGRFDTQADGYLGRWLYWAARAGITYDTWEPSAAQTTVIAPAPIVPNANSSELMLEAALAVGLRWRDLLVSAGWSLSPYRVGADTLHVRFWGGAFLDARSVVRRFVDLNAHVEVLDGGAAAAGSVTVWLRRRVGVAAGLEGAHGAFADSPVVYDRAGGHIGLGWWLTPRVAASLTYAPAWQRATPVAGLGQAAKEFSFFAHMVGLSVTARPPLFRRPR